MVGHPISINGGTEPVWSHDGRELYYRDPLGRTMVVEITPGPTFSRGMPEVLFGYPGRLSEGNPIRSYDIGPGGQRFLIIQSEPLEMPSWAEPPGWSPTHLNVVQSWFEELRQLVPD